MIVLIYDFYILFIIIENINRLILLSMQKLKIKKNIILCLFITMNKYIINLIFLIYQKMKFK